MKLLLSLVVVLAVGSLMVYRDAVISKPYAPHQHEVWTNRVVVYPSGTATIDAVSFITKPE